jgi:hypothetical protein
MLATNKNAYFLPPTLRMTGPVRILLATNKNAYFLPPTLRMTGPVRILLATKRKGDGGRMGPPEIIWKFCSSSCCALTKCS